MQNFLPNHSGQDKLKSEKISPAQQESGEGQIPVCETSFIKPYLKTPIKDLPVKTNNERRNNIPELLNYFSAQERNIEINMTIDSKLYLVKLGDFFANNNLLFQDLVKNVKTACG